MSKSVFWPYALLSVADTTLANLWNAFVPDMQWGAYLSCMELRVSMLFLFIGTAVLARIKPSRLSAVLLILHAAINIKEVVDQIDNKNYASPAPELSTYAWVLLSVILAKIFIGDRPIRRNDSLPLG